MSHIPIEKDPYLGPTRTGKWATHIPELSGFTGIVDGVEGTFWKGRMSIAEVTGKGEWGYDRQLGMWVEKYTHTCLK